MKIAQVGYGYWGRNLMRVGCALKKAQMVLCCDKDPAAREMLKSAHPNVEFCDDYTTIPERADIDAVIIATPAGLHYQQARSALVAGKHVLVEKPLCLTSREARNLIALAKKNRLTLMVGHTFLYNDAVQYVKEKIDAGEVGEIYYASFTRLNLGSIRHDVDALWNLAPHDISIVQYWFGEKPDGVSADGISCLQKGIDDVAFLNLHYPSGRFAHIHVSWLAPYKVRQAIIVGSKKMLAFDDTSPDQRVMIFDKGIDRKDLPGKADALPFQNFAQFTLIQRAGDILIPKIPFREPLQVELQHFVDCAMKGQKPLTDGWNGLEVLEILEAAEKSRKRKKERLKK